MHEKRAYNHRVLCDGNNACICGMRVVKWNKMVQKFSRGKLFYFLKIKTYLPPLFPDVENYIYIYFFLKKFFQLQAVLKVP